MEKELLKIKTSNIQYFVGIGNLIHKFKTIQRSFFYVEYKSSSGLGK
jgi:hypothetical protein